MKKRKPIIAAILTFIFGPFGYLYLGFWYMIMGIVIFSIYVLIIVLINISTPEWIRYIIMAVMAWKAFVLCQIRNVLIDEGYNNIREINSFPLATITMCDLLVGMMVFYFGIVGLYYSIIMIVNGKILKGILFLVFGVPAMIYFLQLIFGFFSNFITALFYKKLEKL